MLEALKALIRRFEGWRSRPYTCPAGVPTIAFGATVYPDGRKVRLSDPPISREQGEAILDHDVQTYVALARKLSPGLTGDRLAAIADFIYNLGAARYRGSTLRRRVNEGNWPEAQRELQKWVWGGGKKLPGLVARRKAESALLARPATTLPADAPKAVSGQKNGISRADAERIVQDALASGRNPLDALLEALG